jgi:glycerophosphoryl diester phosphodiesterase
LLDAGRWKGSAWSGALIPTLDEVLAIIPPATWFFVEIKSGAEIIAPLEKVLRSAGISSQRVRLLSFSAPLITLLKQRLPEWRTCWLCDYRHTLLNNSWHPSPAEVMDTLQRCGADGLASANRACLDKNLLHTLKMHRKELHVWTVDRLPDARHLIELGVDSIMTNRPGWLRQHVSSTR